MEYRKLGTSGLQVSALSLGSWLTFGKLISDEVAEELMVTAYNAGINFFDNAEIYARGKSEIVMGKILKKQGWDRSSYLVSGKVFFGLGEAKPNQRGLSRKHIVEGCHGALRRLQVDYLDLYFCHRPDKLTPIEETVWSMHNLILQGKILYWGTSEWDASEIMEAHLIARQHHLIGPVMEQPQYNMFTRDKMEKEFLHLFKHHGMGTTVWSPLASGILSGKYLDGFPDDTRLGAEGLDWLKDRWFREDLLGKTRKIKIIADKMGTTLPKLSLAWCLKNKDVSTVILGASKVIQLQENLGALETAGQLNDSVLMEIDAVLGNKPVLPEF
ncbi:MAG TPA: aldo/keto reductase [Bacteroidia bacterium]|nr:aldo/keto reductase [Bacteroidia bacterium]